LFARDYMEREGRWGSDVDPYEGKREAGRNQWIRCYYCGEYVTLQRCAISHIIALSEGGPNDIDNLVIAHISCNDFENLERSKRQA
jgi:5-methylcytosine-specific restriction endonuclease McrA